MGISVALYQTIQESHAAGVEKREIARRLRSISRLCAGISARSTPVLRRSQIRRSPQARSGTVLRAF